MFILFIFALVQFSYVEPRCMVVPSCQCKMNYVSPAPRLQRIESCRNPAQNGGYSNEYSAIPWEGVQRMVYAKAYPSSQYQPDFIEQTLFPQSDYYPNLLEEEPEAELFLYGDLDPAMRYRRSVVSEHEHKTEDTGKGVYEKYLQDSDDGENDDETEVIDDDDNVDDDDDGYEALELNSRITYSDEGGEDISEKFIQLRKQKGDIQLNKVVTESKHRDVLHKQREEDVLKSPETFEIKIKDQTQKVGSDGIVPDGEQGELKISKGAGKKTRRSIRDEQFRYQQCIPSNNGYCTINDRYTKGNDYSPINRQPNTSGDDCTISKNLFFGCDMEDENPKETKRNARKVPKTLTQKLVELEIKNKKFKKDLKQKTKQKPKKSKKVEKLDNSLKKDGPLRNKRKENKEVSSHEQVAHGRSYPGGVDRNGAVPYPFQPTFYPQQAPVYYTNPGGQLMYPVRRVYKQYPTIPYHSHQR